MITPRTVCVHAPAATEVSVRVGDPARDVPARPDPGRAGRWTATFPAEPGERYMVVVDGGAPVVDPHAADVEATADGPRGVLRGPWPTRRVASPARRADPVVYELHVKGFGGGYAGCVERLDHVVSLGIDVIELMPVHPFDDRGNYWGYMPIVWGAVHRGYASQPHRAAEELAELVDEAHARGLRVWLDVVVNHTGEGDHSRPAWTLRGLGDPDLYRRRHDGTWADDSGCGNDVDPAHPYVRELVLEALERFVALGVDGFRFDLASLLTRDGGGLVDRITEWAAARDVELVAEAWDLGAYQVGHGWPWPSWRQWNDRFRDDVRGLLRGEPGLVHAVRRRVEGSPDLFGAGAGERSLNFVTAHDGLTMHDLTLVTSDRHRSWDTGAAMRLQQLQNYFCILLLSKGAAMWVMGDELGRSQQGHDNPFDIDGPLTRLDWSAASAWPALTESVRVLVALRRAHRPTEITFHGVDDGIDEGFDSRSLAWSSNGLYVMVNAWWQPLSFGVHERGTWTPVFASADAAPDVDDTRRWVVPARSVLVLRDASVDR